MPTASKLFAAFGFALVCFFAAEVFKPEMPEGTQFGAFSYVSAMIGIVCGWRVMGPAAGFGWWESANAGLRTSIAAVALALLVFSTEQMVAQAFQRRYDTPMEAIVGIISIGIDLCQRLIAPSVLIVLVAGGMLAGMLAEWAARRWR